MKVYMVIVDGDGGGSWFKDRRLAEKLAQEVGGRVSEAIVPNKHDELFRLEIKDGEFEYSEDIWAPVFPDQDPSEVASAIAAFCWLDQDDEDNLTGHYPAQGSFEYWEEKHGYRWISAYHVPGGEVDVQKAFPTSTQIRWARVAKHPADVDPAAVYGPVSPVVLYAPKKRDLPRRMKVWVSTAVPEGDRHFLAMQVVNNKYGKAFG